MMIENNDVILFQGDSITDVGRARDNQLPNNAVALGHGYALMAGAVLLEKYAASQLKIYNRGIGGDRVVDLAARWEQDTLALKPTVLSILVGVNDTWRGQDGNSQRYVPIDQYEQVYRQILTDTRSNLDGIKLILCEPFVLPCGAVNEGWFPEFDQRRAVVKKLADEFDTVFVPFQQAFNSAIEKSDPQYWSGDGVHPTPAGHQLMTQTWLKAAGQ